jgi:hypothetical protein
VYCRSDLLIFNFCDVWVFVDSSVDKEYVLRVLFSEKCVGINLMLLALDSVLWQFLRACPDISRLHL